MIKTSKEIEIMAQGGKILATIVEELKNRVKPGVTTKELDKVAEDLVSGYKVKASFKGHDGFPTALCTSVNEELVHVVPSDRVLKEGDIITLDMGVEYKGFNTDMAITVPVGEIDVDTQRLLRVTKKALKRGIRKLKDGITVGDIGNTIQRYVEDQGYGVIRDLCGHGIGKEVWEDPQILNYGKRKTGMKLKEGMTICIEPIVSVGDYKIKKMSDGFGYQTEDGSLGAHFEHTILITRSGARVLTEL